LETEFLLLSSTAREIPDFSAVLEISYLIMLGLLSLYWRFN